MNILFMGTPDFAATILEAVFRWTADSPGHDTQVTAVYCQPDRPAGRGHKLQPPAVKVLAQSLGLPVCQPLNFKKSEDRDALAALKPDVLVVAAYGLLLPQSVLDIPTSGAFNVHGSLLPRLRGAAPIQRAVMNGDPVTGVTIMRMEAGLDTGPIVLQRATGIGINDTSATLYAELADLGGRLMVEVLELLRVNGTVTSIPQDDHRATLAPKLTKTEGLLPWDAPAHTVHARLRAVTPWPGGRTVLVCNEKQIPVLLTPGSVGERLPAGVDLPAPGTVLGLQQNALAIACADAVYLVPQLRPADRKPMNAKAFWNGYLQGATAVRALLPQEITPA